MSGRDSRTLSKLFEDIVKSPIEYDQTLAKAKEISTTPHRKVIVGLRY